MIDGKLSARNACCGDTRGWCNQQQGLSQNADMQRRQSGADWAILAAVGFPIAGIRVLREFRAAAMTNDDALSLAVELRLNDGSGVNGQNPGVQKRAHDGKRT